MSIALGPQLVLVSDVFIIVARVPGRAKGNRLNRGGPRAHGRRRVLCVRARCVTCLVYPMLV